MTVTNCRTHSTTANPRLYGGFYFLLYGSNSKGKELNSSFTEIIILFEEAYYRNIEDGLNRILLKYINIICMK